MDFSNEKPATPEEPQDAVKSNARPKSSTSIARRNYLKFLIILCFATFIPAALHWFFLTPRLGTIEDFSDLSKHCQDVPPIPAEEFYRRQEKLAGALASIGASAYIAEPGANTLYYGNISTSTWKLSERPLLLIVTPVLHTSVSGQTIARPKLSILMPKFEASRAKLLAIPVDGNVEYVEWAEDESPYKVLSRTLVDEGHSTEIVVDEAIRYFVVEGLRSAGLHVREFPSEVRAIRERKTSIELDILQCANEVTLLAIRRVRQSMHLGMKESQAKDLIIRALRGAGLQDPWALVLFGENAALPHGTGSDRILGKHDLALFDTGGSLHGYSSDVTRTLALSDSAISPRHLEIWFLVSAAQSAAIKTARIGAVTSSVDAVARNLIGAGGNGAYFTHRLGHGIGLEMHETPYLRGGNTALLMEGNTCSNEPGIYIEGEIGVRLEDCFVVTDDGPGRFLTAGVGGPARSPWLP